MSNKELILFAVGFAFSAFIVFILLFPKDVVRPKIRTRIRQQFTEKSYEEDNSNYLFNEVKILCMVMTYPKNHQKKAIHVRNTWGKRCNKLVFMSSKLDPQLDTVVLDTEETREALWNKTRLGLQYAYDHYLNDYDWFFKADDDNFVIVENLRYLLAQYNPKTALYIGHRFSVTNLEEGYMAGAGYVLSKKALQKFIEVIQHNETLCRTGGAAEDRELGTCLANSAIFVDVRDVLHQQRFFPTGVEEHMKKSRDPDWWYFKYEYYPVPQGSLNCCSETATNFHNVNEHEMYLLHYFIYDVHPFGLDDHSLEVLPRKLTLKEIIAASDIEITSPNFKAHKVTHQLDTSEMY